jgi:hypothetical protein
MKSPIFIILFFSLILGCSNEPAKQSTHEVKLFEGTYYTDEWQHSDTLVFESKKPYSKIRSWSMMIWKVSGDSIVRQDCRGLLSFFGKANCAFTLKADLLTLKYESEHESGFDRYKVLTSTRKRLELIALTKSTHPKKDSDIRSDIQLR